MLKKQQNTVFATQHQGHRYKCDNALKPRVFFNVFYKITKYSKGKSLSPSRQDAITAPKFCNCLWMSESLVASGSGKIGDHGPKQ